MFNYALNRLPSERMLRKLYHQTPVRYYSKRNLIRQAGLSLHGIALSSGRGCSALYLLALVRAEKFLSCYRGLPCGDGRLITSLPPRQPKRAA